MKKLLLFMAMLLAVGSSRADGVFKVNGENIQKTPTLVTLDYSRAGNILVQFSDSSVVSYNMNLVEFYPDEVNSVQSAMKEGPFFQKCAWDEKVSERDYVYQVCSIDGCLELYDMTDGRGIFGTHHRFIGNYNAQNCYFLPATDQLVVSCMDGIWVFDAAAMKSKKL